MQARKRRSAPSAPLLETLEPRLLLAGAVVTALDAAGNLTITGDALANQIIVNKTGLKQVTVTGSGGTTVDGAGVKVVDNATGNIKIFMKEGADAVVVGAVGFTFWVGDGTPPPGPFGTPQNPKDLTVDLGAGADLLGLYGLRARNVSILGGTGYNSVQITDDGGGDKVVDGTHILGNLTVTNGPNGCDVTVAGTNILKNCSITTGAGGGFVGFQEDTHASPSYACWIGGNLTISGGANDDQIELRSEVADIPFQVDGQVIVNLGAAVTENALTLNQVSVGGNLRVTGGASADEVTLETGDLDVANCVTLDLANGQNRVQFNDDVGLSVGRDLTIRGGNAMDIVNLGSFTVGRHVSVALGAGGGNSLRLDAASGGFDVGRNLTVTGGSLGDGVLAINGDALSVFGNASFSLGAGNNMVDLMALSGGLYVGGNLTCSGAAGDDEFSTQEARVGGNASFNFGADTNSVILTGLPDVASIGGNLTYTGAGGPDRIVLIDMRVLGRTTLQAGNAAGGPNELELTLCEFVGALTYTGGAGGNDVRLRNCRSLATTAITTGNDADTVALFDATTFKRLTVNAGGGMDGVFLGNDELLTGGWETTVFNDNVFVNMGAGSDSLQIGGASPALYASIFLGEQVKFDGGADNDALIWKAQYLFLFTPVRTNW